MIILGFNESKTEYIVNIEADELANLFGFYSKYDDGFKKSITVGTEINVNELYHDARRLEDLNKRVSDNYELFKDLMAIMHKHMVSSRILKTEVPI